MSQLRLQSVSKAAVRVAVRAQSLDHGIRRGTVEQYGDAVTIKQARISEDELASGQQVDRHTATLGDRQRRVFQESDRGTARQATDLLSHVGLACIAGRYCSLGQ